MNDPDLALVERFQRGEHEVFRGLAERHAPRLFNAIAQMTADRAAAEDLLQDAMLAAYNALPRFRGECAVYTWLYRIAYNKTLNWIRKRKGCIGWESLDEPVRSADGGLKRDVPDYSDSPERQAEQNEMGRRIGEAVSSLGEGYRVVFTLREIEGLEFEEIARLLNCSQEAVRTRLHRAKKELKERLRPYLEDREVAVP